MHQWLWLSLIFFLTILLQTNCGIQIRIKVLIQIRIFCEKYFFLLELHIKITQIYLWTWRIIFNLLCEAVNLPPPPLWCFYVFSIWDIVYCAMRWWGVRSIFFKLRFKVCVCSRLNFLQCHQQFLHCFTIYLNIDCRLGWRDFWSFLNGHAACRTKDPNFEPRFKVCEEDPNQNTECFLMLRLCAALSANKNNCFANLYFLLLLHLV